MSAGRDRKRWLARERRLVAAGVERALAGIHAPGEVLTREALAEMVAALRANGVPPTDDDQYLIHVPGLAK